LQPGDVVLREGTRIIRNPFDWQAALLDLRVGSPARLHIKHGTRELDVDVNIADRPEVTAPKVQVLRELELVTVTPAIAQERGLRRPYGALVYRSSPLVTDQTGLQQGDVILQINNAPIRVAEDVAKAIDYYASRSYLRVIFERQGQVSWTEFGIR
jgi:serine protease Do